MNWILSYHAGSCSLKLTSKLYDTTYWFMCSWISVWAWWGMSRSSTWWSVWIIWLWSIIIIISIVHWRSTSWRCRLHVTTTSSYTENTWCLLPTMYLQMRKTRYPKTLLHCTTLGFSPVESYNRLQKKIHAGFLYRYFYHAGNQNF